MRILLDECVPGRLRKSLTSHEVTTVPRMGWASIENGALLALAQTAFDVFLTVDRNLPYQQNIGKYEIALVILRGHDNRLETLEALVSGHLSEIESAKPGTVIYIGDK